jgi:hypothetical protein
MQVPKGFKLLHDQQKYNGWQEPRVLANRLPSSRQDPRGLQSSSYAKFVVTPHQRSTILVEQITQQIHQKLE